MSLITAAFLATGLLIPADASAPPQRQILALNPQPEPPGKSKIKRSTRVGRTHGATRSSSRNSR